MRFNDKRCLRRLLPPSWVAVLTAMVLASACDQPTAIREAVPVEAAAPGTRPARPKPPPDVSVKISKVNQNWKDRQQVFQLALTNHGEQPVAVHALIYATNEALDPPRRAISPATAFEWFTVAGSSDGKLTAQDVERGWKTAGFGSARGQQLRKTWSLTINPEATKVEDCSHDLEEVSKHPLWKDKKLSQAPYTQYQVWLFTADGRCFLEGTIPALGDAPELRTPKPAPDEAKPPQARETKPVDPKVEAEAARELKLANYYLGRKRSADAKARFKLIIEKYPATEAAKTAQQQLQELETS